MDDMDQRKVAQAMQQQLMLLKNFASVTHRCFMKCVPRPGKILTHTEDTCASNCVDRHKDVKTFIVERLQEKAEIEKSKSGMVSH